jgi:hypothetical protein
MLPMQNLLRRYFIFTTLIILSGFSFSCSSSVSTKKERDKVITFPEPAWVRSITNAGYPASRYLVGRGMARESGNIVKDQELADYRAFSEIANQILASIKSHISIEQTEISRDKTSEILGTTTANISITSSIVVSGLLIVDRYYSAKDHVYYSLAVLDREVASTPFRMKLMELKNQYESSLLAFKRFRKEGKIFRSLSELKRAYECAHTFNDVLPFYRLFKPVTDLYDDDLKALSINEPVSLASEVIANLSIHKIRGDEQEGIIGRPLSLPLELKVVLRDTIDIPAEGLSLLFRFSRGTGKINERAVTKNDGVASNTVEVLQRSENGLYSVKATLDFSGLMDTSSEFSNWNNLFLGIAPSTIFSIHLKKVPSIKVLLIIDEDNGVSSTSIETLSRELTKIGFNVLKEKEIGKINSLRIRRLLKQNEIERLQSEFLSKFSILVLGEFRSAYFDQYEGIQIYTVTGNIKAVSIDQNMIIAEESLTDARGFGNNPEQAKINALQNAGQRVAESLINQILSIY